MRHILNLSDLGTEGLIAVLALAERLRAQRGKHSTPLTGRSVALVFEKASTRTRVSMEVAVAELGGHPIYITPQGSQLGRDEPMADTARVLSRMVSAIGLRTSSVDRIIALAEHSQAPVLNLLTDESHPLQILADLQTVKAEFGKLEGLRYAWLGDGNNVAYSWIEAAGLLKLNLSLATPPGYEPDADAVAKARARGATITLTQDPKQALAGAHVVNTDVFVSMGQDGERAARLAAFAGFGLTEELLKHAEPNAIVLHCLPAHRGEEIDEAVLEGAQARVWDQAECRLHTAKAALCWALEVDV